MLRRLFLLLSLAVLSCGRASTVEPPGTVALGGTFPLRVGQTVRVEGEPLHLRFDAVLEDSRCPGDVVCVWEGNARLRLLLGSAAPPSQPVELNTALEPRTASAPGYRVELERLEPQPRSSGPIAQRAYTAHLRVSRAP